MHESLANAYQCMETAIIKRFCCQAENNSEINDPYILNKDSFLSPHFKDLR